MIPPYVHGPIAPVFTACNEDGSLDDEGQRNLLDYLVENGSISAYFIRSGMGQMYTFSFEEVQQIVRTACTHLGDRGPVLAGCSGIWDRNYDKRPDPELFITQGIELSRFAEQQGAAGVVFTMPEALIPKDDQTIADMTLAYFERVSVATDLPIFIYQPPGTAKEYCVDIDLIQKLADLPTVMGMKVSTTMADYVLDLTWAVADKDFGFISGAETAFYAGLCSGSRAVIGQGATINPQILLAIQDCFEEENFTGAIEAQRVTNMLVQKSNNPVVFFKRYVTEKGYPVKPYLHGAGGSPYAQGQSISLSDDDYRAFKHLLEAELERYS